MNHRVKYLRQSFLFEIYRLDLNTHNTHHRPTHYVTVGMRGIPVPEKYRDIKSDSFLYRGLAKYPSAAFYVNHCMQMRSAAGHQHNSIKT